MALNSVSTSLVSATQENMLALASMKTDISLIKVEVPKEYTGLNAALTSKRKAEAEDGNAHKTARRLGILFQDLLPRTPELLRAYGSRSSEIGEKMRIKAQSTTKGGVFAGFLGVDITSIWAAATSGASSIAAHLLACLLARMWPASEATSIWVEIVAERRRTVQEELQQGVYKTSLELALICKDDISRKDLAEWDAGARAWLQVADEAQMHRQKQLMLIVKNIDLPVNTQGSTYERVLDAWITALQAMERLITGLPQRVSKGAILLGIASWHLYPDLLVLGESMIPVTFNDKLISPMGKLTVGLETTDPDRHDGIFWSLPLSHLRFYGDPVMAKTTARDNLRLSMAELQLVMFGSAICNWGGHYLDPIQVAKFFRQLRIKLDLPQSGLEQQELLAWLQPLLDASEVLLSTPEDGLNDALSIMALGRRSGRDFVSKAIHRPPPFFGISQPFILELLKGPPQNLESQRQGVERMRFLAAQLRLSPGEAIIRAIPSFGERPEYFTASPHVDCTFRALAPQHGRWYSSVVDRDYRTERCECHKFHHDCHKGCCVCIASGRTCGPQCHDLVEEVENDVRCPGGILAELMADLANRRRNNISTQSSSPQANEFHGHDSYPQGRGSQCRCGNLPHGAFILGTGHDPFRTLHLGPELSPHVLGIGLSREEHLNSQVLQSKGHQNGLCSCYQSQDQVPSYGLVAGDSEGVALFVRIDHKPRQLRRRLKQALKDAAHMGWIKEADVAQPTAIQIEELNSETLRAYLRSLKLTGLIRLPKLSRELDEAEFRILPYLNSLRAFQLARGVYQKLSGATASLRVIDRPLQDAQWSRAGGSYTTALRSGLPRAQRFACIAFFESGGYDLHPEEFREVIAISTRNSLYVSEVLLGDPFSDLDMNEIRHVMGNVGKTGVVMMVAPLAPRVRSAQLDRWKQISHLRFNKAREDCFRATSLHLSFTDFEMPFDIGQRGSIDKDIHVRVVETVISVYDRTDWVADLDVLLLYEPAMPMNRFIHRLNQSPSAQDPSPSGHDRAICRIKYDPLAHVRPQPLTSIDNWEELLNIPPDMGLGHIGVVRAHDNWIARLATACVAAQKGFRTVILPTTDVCWECCAAQQWKWLRNYASNDPCGDGQIHKEVQAGDVGNTARGRPYEWASAPRQQESRKPTWHEVHDSVELFNDESDDSDGSDESDNSVESTGTVMADDVFPASPHIFIC
ncbi:hypothetical protein QBC34DRAFT_145493 [Podospora aff. communis PSN243]|uniref:Uncharacterized protein n=1 Tax=Podospora aff. communis PSN243 TaxID=3040156 RepID=A0AAV9GGK5_9PEZI|nr:hypothetical protein QBC34DRAFT_145493 [Podospora aff. communis PSN243]